MPQKILQTIKSYTLKKINNYHNNNKFLMMPPAVWRLFLSFQPEFSANFITVQQG